MNDFLLLTILALAVRLFSVHKNNIGHDTYGHLYFAKEIKEQKTGPFGAIKPKVVGADSFRNPFLWNWIISFFDINRVLKVQKWINPTIDAFFAVLIYFVVIRVGYSESIALQTMLVYLLTPMWFSRFSIGPRISSLTPRLTGELVTNLYFMLMFLPLGIAEEIVYIVIILLGLIILLTSKFGIQAMLFLTPLVALLTWDIKPLIVFLLSLFLGVAITRGQLLKAIKIQIEHLVAYYKKNLSGEMIVSDRNKFSGILDCIRKKQSYSRKILSVISQVLVLNSYTAVLIKMPILLLVIFFSLYEQLGTGEYLPDYMSGIILSALIVFFLVNFPSLLFLGEAERYLNHVAFFIVLLCVVQANKLGFEWLVFMVICYGFLFLVIEYFIIRYLFKENFIKKEKVNQKLLEFLSSQKTQGVILSYPYHAGCGAYRIMLSTCHQVVSSSLLNGDFKKKYTDAFVADYPFIKLEKLDHMASELGVNIFIADSKALNNRGYCNWSPSEQWKRVHLGLDELCVYQRTVSTSS